MGRHVSTTNMHCIHMYIHVCPHNPYNQCKIYEFNANNLAIEFKQSKKHRHQLLLLVWRWWCTVLPNMLGSSKLLLKIVCGNVFQFSKKDSLNSLTTGFAFLIKILTFLKRKRKNIKISVYPPNKLKSIPLKMYSKTFQNNKNSKILLSSVQRTSFISTYFEYKFKNCR